MRGESIRTGFDQTPIVAGPTREKIEYARNVPPELRAEVSKVSLQERLDPLNLFSIAWRREHDQIHHFGLLCELTSAKPDIVVLVGGHLPAQRADSIKRQGSSSGASGEMLLLE